MNPKRKALSTAVAMISAILLWLPGLAAGAEEAVDRPQYLELNLQSAVELGLKNNPKIQAMEFAVERSRSDTKSVRGRFFAPSFGWLQPDST